MPPERLRYDSILAVGRLGCMARGGKLLCFSLLPSFESPKDFIRLELTHGFNLFIYSLNRHLYKPLDIKFGLGFSKLFSHVKFFQKKLTHGASNEFRPTRIKPVITD